MPPIIQMLLSFYCGGGDRWCEVVVATAAVAEEEDSLAVVLLAVLLLWLVIDVALIGFVSWWRFSVEVDDGGCFESLLSCSALVFGSRWLFSNGFDDRKCGTSQFFGRAFLGMY